MGENRGNVLVLSQTRGPIWNTGGNKLEEGGTNILGE